MHIIYPYLIQLQIIIWYTHSYVIRLHVFISVVIASSGGPLPESSRSAWIAQQFSMVQMFENPRAII